MTAEPDTCNTARYTIMYRVHVHVHVHVPYGTRVQAPFRSTLRIY